MKWVPIVAGADKSQALGVDFAANLSTFVETVIAMLGRESADAYAQILL